MYLRRFYTQNIAKTKTLEDSFKRKHRYLRISLTEKCTYCMPQDGVELTPNNYLLTKYEILKLSKLFVNQGVDKIRLTGGEPLIRKDLVDIVAELNQLKSSGLKTIGITTNAIALKNKLPDLLKNGLDSVNISLDTLDPFKYQLITRRKGLERVLETINLSLKLGVPVVKVNCVVINGINEMEICDFLNYFKFMNVIVRFIEYMPFDGNQWKSKKLVPSQELLARIQKEFENIKKVEDHFNDTTKHYQIDGFQSKFGFISSMTQPFCRGCDRVRITADGNIKVCLFSNKEVSLRDLIRNGCSDDQILDVVEAALKGKKFAHDGMEKLALDPNRPMIKIGDYNFNHSNKPSFLGIFVRPYSIKRLSHINEDTGKVQMVDVSQKIDTIRTATAIGSVKLSPEAIKEIKSNSNKKGNVLEISKIAGIQGAKLTSQLIPLCHPLPLTYIDVSCDLDEQQNLIVVKSFVKCNANTGVEMEALTAVSIASLTVVDMCKSLGLEIEILNIRVLSKTGGKSDFTQSQ